MSRAASLRRAWWGVRHEWSWAFREVEGGRGTYLYDVVAYRLLSRIRWVPGSKRLRRMTLRSGETLWYRCNRGDVQGIREIFNDEIYRLPDGAAPIALLDLGANIGLATVYLAHRYHLSSVTCVEPVPDNVDVLRRNVADNAIAATIVLAAAGSTSGRARFDAGLGTNMGRLGHGSIDVEVMTVTDIINSCAVQPDLVKIDIEGAEGDVLVPPPEWLSHVGAVLIEIHPERVDLAQLIETLQDAGFTYFPPVESTHGVVRSKRERLFVRPSLHWSR